MTFEYKKLCCIFEDILQHVVTFTNHNQILYYNYDMTYLLDAHCTFVKVVKLFLTVRRLARTLKHKIRKNRDEKQKP